MLATVYHKSRLPIQERLNKTVLLSVNNSNSPMLDRVVRDRTLRRVFSFLPRKGRIRFFIVISLLALMPKVVPNLIKRVVSYDLPFKQKKQPPRSRAHENGIVQGSFTRAVREGMSRNLSKHPKSLSCIHVIPGAKKDSLIVYTSIDTSLKRYLDGLLSRYHPLYGAIVALDPVIGRIFSLVSYTHDSMPDVGANLCLKSCFPAASTFKTVTAAAAIEYKEYFAGCLLEHRGKTSTLYTSQIKKELDWTVDMSFSQAYARSVNAVFARIGIHEVGLPGIRVVAESFGFNTVIPGELECEQSVAVCNPDSVFEIAEFASGFNQRTTLSPLHGALIAAAIAENGCMPVPTLIDSVVTQKDGIKKYSRSDESWQRAIQPPTAAELRQLMQTVVASGTARKHFKDIRNSRRFDDFIYGGKTGSVDKDKTGRVDWFIGFAKHPVREKERIAVGVLTVHGAYWTVHSSYLAAEAMRYYLKSVQDQDKRLAEKKNAGGADSSQ